MPKELRTAELAKVRHELKGLCRVLGEKRTYDVALSDAKAFHLPCGALEKRKAKAEKRVKSVLKARRSATLAHLDSAVKLVKPLPPVLFAPRIERLRRELARAGKHKPKSSAARHRLRIELRKARYLLELFHDEVPRLVELQDELGRWHDLRVLAQLVEPTREIRKAQKKARRRADRRIQPAVKKTARNLEKIAEDLERGPA